MITNDEIKISEKLEGKVISINNYNIRIPYTVDIIKIYPIPDIINEEDSKTGLIFYDKKGNCLGADRIDMNIVEFCKVGREYFK